MLGGRKSPSSPVVEAHRLRLWEADGPSTPGCPVVELTRLPLAEDLALHRWRHTATEVAHQGSTGALPTRGVGLMEEVWGQEGL